MRPTKAAIDAMERDQTDRKFYVGFDRLSIDLNKNIVHVTKEGIEMLTVPIPKYIGPNDTIHIKGFDGKFVIEVMP